MQNNITKAKRIGIDARFYGPVGKGLGRYTQEIVDNILKLDQQNKYVIFLCKENFNEFDDSKNIKKVLADAKWYSFTEQIKMPWLIWKEHLDLMHFPHFNVPIFCPTKFIVTIHDLILTKFPTTRATTLGPILYKIKNFFYKLVIWLAVKRAKKIITVSHFTKNDIMKKFKIKTERIIVTYEGVANFTKGREGQEIDDKKIILGYNINSFHKDVQNKPFLFYVGNAYPHKNLEGLIKVYIEIYKSNPNLALILVGKEDYFYKRLKDFANKLNIKVIFPGYVPDNQLGILYRQALAYVFPSFYEGFGLPALEAMAYGCPVVSSNQASMPEILGNAAIYFNPYNEKEMANQIKKIIEDDNLRQTLIKKGLEQVKKYSWQECAKETLAIYHQI